MTTHLRKLPIAMCSTNTVLLTADKLDSYSMLSKIVVALADKFQGKKKGKMIKERQHMQSRQVEPRATWYPRDGGIRKWLARTLIRGKKE